MAASSSLTIEVAQTPHEAEAAVYQAFCASGLQSVAGGGGVMRGSVPTSWASWGENVTATIGHGPRGAVVALRSECAFALTLVDWGKNRKNLDRVVTELRALAPVV